MAQIGTHAEDLIRRALLKLRVTRLPWARNLLFRTYYSRNTWSDADSRSGGGSGLTQTATIRRELPVLFEQLSIRTLLDVPCGDGYWWSKVEHDLDRYIGVDLVPQIVASLRARADQRSEYRQLDVLTDPLPKADAILCRDLLVHFSEPLILESLHNLKQSGATYLIATTFPGRENREIETGQWRPIDMQASPFNFPAPVALINENCTEADGRYSDKSLGVWRFADLSVRVEF